MSVLAEECSYRDILPHSSDGKYTHEEGECFLELGNLLLGECVGLC